MEKSPTETLADFATGASYKDLPRSTREFARNWLLDSVACALAGDLGDEVEMYSRFARNVAGGGQSTVVGSAERLSLLGASLLNGYLITAVTVCDTYVPGHAHISPEIIPPALGVAERDRASGKSLLTSVAIGAEVAVRVALGLNFSVTSPRGWHLPGIVGPFGAAAAVGQLRKFDAQTMTHAFGLAGTQSAGTWASWGTPAVKFHQSRGAASGLMAALLAEQGFTASTNILSHADGGMFTTYSDGGRPEELRHLLGERYEMEQISLRLWPGGTPLQSALTAAFDLIAAERPAFADIEKVMIYVAPKIKDSHGRFAEPSGTFEALLSHRFTVSSALRAGRFWLDLVTDETINHPEMKAFIKDRVELIGDAGLAWEQARIKVVMKDGQSFSAGVPGAKGSPINPASLDDLCQKFERCVAGKLTASDADELLDILVRIDEIESLDRFFELMRPKGSRRQ